MSNTWLERALGRVIPEKFMNGEDAFRAKLLWIYSVSLGVLALVILIALSFAEGDMPMRRLGTVALSSCLLFAPILMRFMSDLTWVSVVVESITIATVFYVDFNNLSIAGPSTVLWGLPIALSATLFSGRWLVFFFVAALGLFTINIYGLFAGWLPEPIVQAESWPYALVAYAVFVAIIVLVCTRGMSSVAETHLQRLSDELQQKQQHIQQISRLQVEAESATRSKSMFLATMSHELRTPLNSVIGNAQLLARSDIPKENQTKVNDIVIASNLLLMLINDILDFSKLEQNELTLIEEPYDLTQQISELARMMSSKLKEAVQLHLDLPEERIYIHADQNRISQVLMNLLSNAMKFTDSGSIRIAVSEFEPSGIRIAITDTGIGISQSNIEHLFTEFSQLTNDSARNMEGTGLGLAISMGIMKRMGGDITVSSELEKGSCFTVELPNKRISGLHVATEQSNIGSTKQGVLSGLSVLVVDDIAMNCTVMESMLLDFNAQHVVSVNSGSQALEYIARQPDTHLVFMDMRMPEMDGTQATRRLRQQGYTGKIVAVTANASEKDRQACLDAGMDGFISKPIVMEGLEITIKNVLAND